MGTSAIQEFNNDIYVRGDLNVYICGKINPNSRNYEDIFNYNIVQLLFNTFVNEGKIRANNFENYIYPYVFRKLEKPKDQKTNVKKEYNAFLFFNNVDEIFSKILIEEHLYEEDLKNKNNNVIIYFGNENYIENSLENLSQISQETLPFLITIKNISNYSEELKYINYIPNINAIWNSLSNQISNNQLSEMCQKALFNYILTKLHRIDMYYNQLGFNYNMLNPFNETHYKIKTNLTIAVVGYSGCGKSTLINLLFNELVSKTSSSAKDITTKCSEYYLPINNANSENLGQIRFLDFPGITEQKYYENVVEPEINKKIEEYKKTREQIDIALFFIPSGIEREFTETGLKLVNLLHEKKIRIIFIINGPVNSLILEQKKNKLKNTIKNNEILYDDFSNLINTDFCQFYQLINKNGLLKVIDKIIETIEIKIPNFEVEDITINNYNEKLLLLKNSTRLFELYENMSDMKESIKQKAKLAVFGFSALSCGTSALSMLVPLVDAAASIAYQVAMVYSIFSIYELDANDYKIANIILSGGNTIELEDNYRNINGNNDNRINPNDEVVNGNIREGLGDAAKVAVFAGKCGLQSVAKEEASKIVIQKSIETVVKESVGVGTLKYSLFSGCSLKAATSVAVSHSVEKIAIESTKELAEQSIIQGTKTFAAQVSKEAIVSASTEGLGVAVNYGSKETIKTVTEQIVVQQGGKAWLVNLGKAVPFIGAGISAIMNTYSTAKIGTKLVNKLDKEFDNNRQRKVDIIKGKVYGLYNIIEQFYIMFINC